MKRIVVTGSESTGKTTLARKLADRFDAEFVPEFVREFAASKDGPITFSDHGPITKGQMALEDKHIDIATRRSAFVVQDTDLLSTVVYCNHYFGSCPQWIVDAARERRPDLYLLAEIDVPWIADGIRDRGNLREEMQSLFRDAVASSQTPWVSVSGTWEQRWSIAVEAVNRMSEART